MKEVFAKSLCRPSAFNQRGYATAAICKPYIFRRADLFNTEIIITITPRPLIKSALSVGTYGRQFNVAAFAAKTSDQSTAHTG